MHFIIVGFFSLLFLSTGIDKILHFEKHSKIMSTIIDNKSIKNILFSLLIVLELTASVLLFSQNSTFENIGLLLSILILTIYSVFMSYYILFKENSKKPTLCNCGGVLGDSVIRWKLVLRNVFFIILTLYALFTNNLSFEIETYLIVAFKIVGMIISIVYYLVMRIKKILTGGDFN